MLKKILILIFVFSFVYSQTVTEIINDKVDFKNIPGFQVRFEKTSDGFLYCNLTGNATTMNGTCHLFLKKTKSEVDKDMTKIDVSKDSLMGLLLGKSGGNSPDRKEVKKKTRFNNILLGE